MSTETKRGTYCNRQQECIPLGCVPPAHTVSHSICHTHPPAMHAPLFNTCPLPCIPHPHHACHLPHTPPMHAPLPHMASHHTCPPVTRPPCHASPPLPRMSPLPCMHLPPPHCGQNSWQTLLKIFPCSNFVAGGNKIRKQESIPIGCVPPTPPPCVLQ